MSTRHLSPTANLLRNSRLFSLPPPLPRPSPDLTVLSITSSETATTPYPIHAAIETTQASLARGDWGLKRPLPLKSTTKTSTPVIHIDNVDSIDHITDFGSAADHALTLKKWQELGMPLSRPEKRTSTSGLAPAKSVFESQYDNTHAGGERSSSGSSRSRWKYQGPWLAGKTDGEFNEYLEKKVKKRKLDFKRFLSEHLTRINAANRRREAVEKGEDPEDATINETTASEKDVQTYIRHLRNSREDLNRLVEEYLDLPRDEGQLVGETSTYMDQLGPPTTHPSAGLSYLRTGTYIHNHAELGPRDKNAPVQGRVIVPQKVGDRTKLQAFVGVAGVVGKDARKTFWKNQNGIADKGVDSFDPDIPGGGKLWTHPSRASIDPHGRIDLQLDRADRIALNTALGTEDNGTKPPSAAVAGGQNREFPYVMAPRNGSQRSSRGYGLEDIPGAKKNERPTPFLGPDDKMPENALSELLRTGAFKPNPNRSK